MLGIVLIFASARVKLKIADKWRGRHVLCGMKYYRSITECILLREINMSKFANICCCLVKK